MTPSRGSVTNLLIRWRNGDKAALDELMPLVYREMHRCAHNYMRRERPGNTLQTSAVVNEAYMRLIDYKLVKWQDRAHFMAVAAVAMRRVLVDHANYKRAKKRRAILVPLDEAVLTADKGPAELLALDEALKELAKYDPRKSQIVELLYFGGLTIKEAAEVVGVSQATVSREWKTAKALLLRAITGTESKQDIFKHA
jgi:RNA polymerase sigma factor (TIGR02999 family)